VEEISPHAPGQVLKNPGQSQRAFERGKSWFRNYRIKGRETRFGGGRLEEHELSETEKRLEKRRKG